MGLSADKVCKLLGICSCKWSLRAVGERAKNEQRAPNEWPWISADSTLEGKQSEDKTGCVADLDAMTQLCRTESESESPRMIRDKETKREYLFSI